MSITYIFMPALSVKLMSLPIYLTFVKKTQTNKQTKKPAQYKVQQKS